MFSQLSLTNPDTRSMRWALGCAIWVCCSLGMADQSPPAAPPPPTSKNCTPGLQTISGSGKQTTPICPASETPASSAESPATTDSARDHAAATRRHENQRTFAGMLQPFARLAPQAQTAHAQRSHLTPEQRAQCQTLDTHMPALEQQVRRSQGEEQSHLQRTLRQARQMYRELRC